MDDINGKIRLAGYKEALKTKKLSYSEGLVFESKYRYDIDEYDERFLRHLALGYTKEMIASLKGMPFGVKSLEKRQNDLIGRLFPNGERVGVNATRLAVRALELRIIDLDNLEADEE